MLLNHSDLDNSRHELSYHSPSFHYPAFHHTRPTYYVNPFSHSWCFNTYPMPAYNAPVPQPSPLPTPNMLPFMNQPSPYSYVRATSPHSDNFGLTVLLIAILVLLALDIVIVRPRKYTRR